MKRDHDILHRFAEHLNEASTGSTLVRNDMYGISHEVAYSQDLLTLTQIKDMHDAWCEQYDPIGHTTPIYGPSSKELKHINRWDEVIIKTPNNTNLTKRDIYRYYSNPEVKKQLFEQLKDKPILVRQAMDTTDSWLKRNQIIRKNVNNEDDPEDLQYYISRRNVEFHPTTPDITDKIVIDLDPGKGLKLDDVKKVTAYLVKFLENQPFIKDVEIQFSGNRGFYIWGHLSGSLKVDDARDKLKKLLSNTKEMGGIKVTLRNSPGAKTVKLDLSPMKRLGSVKAEGSLDYRTGYVSTMVLPSRLKEFNPEKDATIDKDNLKPVYSLRDGILV